MDYLSIILFVVGLIAFCCAVALNMLIRCSEIYEE